MNGKIKYYLLLFVVVFLGYMFVYPYLTQALGGIAGAYTSGAATALLSIGCVWALKKFGKQGE